MKKGTGVCDQNPKWILELIAAGKSLSEVARTVHTNRRHIRLFLVRLGIVKHFPYCRPGKDHPHWKGGRTFDKSGYVLVLSPNHPSRNRAGYVREHRLVMESVLGRYLERDEVVHHRNGIKNDNRPENLELFSTNGHHLAAELNGRCPKWSEGGLARMRSPRRRVVTEKLFQTLMASGQDAPRLIETLTHLKASPLAIRRFLSRRARTLASDQRGS